MSYNHLDPPRCCENTTDAASNPKSSELKVYQFFMFCAPIFFTFVLLFLFYLFYLRPRRVNWSSFRMRTSSQIDEDISRVELGLKKELREMLPIIVYKESFSVRDTQCSVCLGDFQAEDRLQQIPACGHTFHIDCIDSWLANHATCPLCRLSLLASAKSPAELTGVHVEVSDGTSVVEDNSETSLQQRCEACEDFPASKTRDPKTIQNSAEEDPRSSHCVDPEREVPDTRDETIVHQHSTGFSAR